MAQIYLGVMYQSGEYGVEKDAKEGLKWWLKAAEQGDGYAQTKLGGMYRKGQGVKQDDAEAVQWYRKAAEQGYAYEQYVLGAMYHRGEGVTKNLLAAYAWYTIAAANGYTLAVTWKANAAKKLTPGQLAQAEALVKQMTAKNPKLLNKK